MTAYSNTKKINIFRNGLALSAALACLVTAYSFTKNTSLDFLLYLFLTLIFAVLVGSAITYFAYKRLDDILEQLNIPIATFLVFFLHTINLLFISKLILAAFIHFKVAYGYFMLPVAIDIVGAIILASIVRLLSYGGMSISTRLTLLTIATALIVTAAVAL